MKNIFRALLLCGTFYVSPEAYASTALNCSQVEKILKHNLNISDPCEEEITSFEKDNLSLIEDLKKEISEDQRAHRFVAMLPKNIADIFSDNCFDISQYDLIHNFYSRIDILYKQLISEGAASDLLNESFYKKVITKVFTDPDQRRVMMLSYYYSQAEKSLESWQFLKAKAYFDKTRVQHDLVLVDWDSQVGTQTTAYLVVKSNNIRNKFLSLMLESRLFNTLPTIFQDQCEMALKAFSKLLKGYPSHEITELTAIAGHYLRRNKYQDCINIVDQFFVLLSEKDEEEDLEEAQAREQVCLLMQGFKARSLCALGENEAARKCAEEVLSNINAGTSIQSHIGFVLSIIAARQGDWKASFQHFEKAFNVMGTIWPTKEGIAAEDELLLLEMLLRHPAVSDYYIKRIVEIVDHPKEFKTDLHKVKNKLARSFEERSITDFKKKYLTAFAQNLIAQARRYYAEMEREYQKFWAKMPAFPNEGQEYDFHIADAFFCEAHAVYQDLIELSKQSNLVDQLLRVRTEVAQLQKLSTKFLTELSLAEMKLHKEHRKLKALKVMAEGAKSVESYWQEFSEKVQKRKVNRGLGRVQSPDLGGEKLATSESRALQPLPEKSENLAKELSHPSGQPDSIQPSKLFMINSFGCKETETIWLNREAGAYPASVLSVLEALNRAQSIHHLRTLLTPGTKLEILSGKRAGQISLRINDEYRLCFQWVTGEGAHKVELTRHYKGI